MQFRRSVTNRRGIWVRKEKLYLLFEPVCKKLNTALELVEELAVLDEAKFEMFKFFLGEEPPPQ